MVLIQGGNTGDLKDVKTNNIIPVDLNALMYMNYMIVSEFHSLLGDTPSSEKFIQKAAALKATITKILWCDDEKMWFDYDLENNRPRKYFYPSNMFPLWADCYDTSNRDQVLYPIHC